jgi:hypothetical protein
MHITKDNLTKDNAIFFMDMVGSVLSPNYVPGLYKTKPYKRMLLEKDSDYQRFIGLFSIMNYVLSKREVFILETLYGVNKEKASILEVSKMLQISHQRVRQIRHDAELKIVRELKWYFDI